MLRLLSLTSVVLCASTALSSSWLFDIPSFVTLQQGEIQMKPEAPVPCQACQFEPKHIVFTGDLMLARHVERLAIENNDRYSFAGLTDILERTDVVVTNFEASIPTPHVPTPDFTMRFSVPYRLAALLPEYNVLYASLANNHSDDHGEAMYSHTKDMLERAGVAAFGHPSQVDSSSISYIKLQDVTVAIIGLHTLYQRPTTQDVMAVFAEAAKHSDWQVAYVHWGVEYEPYHSLAQQEFATTLVAAGADVVIGHHPHVVQDVSMIDGVPIFYSLGNFIFDQYFSSAVQEGLLLRLDVTKESIAYQLIPVTSKYSMAQPQLMAEVEASRFLSDLRIRSGLTRHEQKIVGLRLPDGLATSTQISIMTE